MHDSSRFTSPRHLLLRAGACLALFAAGCGGDDTSAVTPAPSPESPASAPPASAPEAPAYIVAIRVDALDGR
ncbi:MAG TPA: hypothetical protein VMG12_34875, partial [Polyangiaceae bacterium]|nr:hypothetical protein [Polyangiaceae bacterium]